MRNSLHILLVTLVLFLVFDKPAQAQGTPPGNPICTSISPTLLPGGSSYQVFITNHCAYDVWTVAVACSALVNGSCPPSSQTEMLGVSPEASTNFFFEQTPIFLSLKECPTDTSIQAGQNSCVSANSPLAAAVLPNSAVSQIGGTEGPPTVFATVENTGATALTNCRVTVTGEGSSSFSLTFQTTNPATNQPTGSPNATFNLPGNSSQSLVLTFHSQTAFSSQIFPVFSCDSLPLPAPVSPGTNTVQLAFTTQPTADITALAQTAGTNGVLSISLATDPQGAFAVATTNSGISEAVTVKPVISPSSLLASALVCQTNPSTGACLSTPATSLSVQFTVDATPTFSVFVTANQKIPLNPNTNRVALTFTDSSGVLVGSTSVALEAQ